MTNPLPPIVCFSTEEWDTPLPTNKKQLMQRIAASGTRVLWIDTVGTRLPRLNAADVGRAMRRLKRRGVQEAAHNVTRLAPLAFPGAPGGFNRALFGRKLGKAIADFAPDDWILWIYNPYAMNYLDALPSPALTVYHCVDDLSKVPGARGDAIRRCERQTLERADLVFCSSPALHEKCTAANVSAHYMPNVADFDHFHRAASREAVESSPLNEWPTPRIVFSGNLVEYKVDFNLLAACAAGMPEASIILIGPEWVGNPSGALDRLKDLKNMHFTGAVPYEELPEWLAAADVLIIPYRQSEETKTIFPLKFFEFLATGKPVVATRLDALAEFSDIVPLTSGADETIAALRKALEVEENKEIRERRLSLARQYTWDRRLDEMRELIRQVLRNRKKS